MLDIDKSAEHPPLALESAVADDTHTDTWFTADVISGVHTYVGLAGEWVVLASGLKNTWGLRYVEAGQPTPLAPRTFSHASLSPFDPDKTMMETETMLVIDFKFRNTRQAMYVI